MSLLPARLAGLRRRSGAERTALLRHLSPITYTPDTDEQQLFEQAGLGRVLPLLLGLDQEAAFTLCHDAVRHRLGEEPDPGSLPF